MKKATITYTKNHLSQVLGMVREGETVLVTDRKTPVARIEPVDARELDEQDRLAALIRKGIVALPRRRLDAKAFLKGARPETRNGASAVEALLKDREESR